MTRKPNGYWTEQIIISELQLVVDKLGYIPTQENLRKMGKSDLEGAITLFGGLNYFRNKMGYQPLQKIKGYWTNKTIIAELNKVINKVGHFPTSNELSKMGVCGLSAQISLHGGYNYFREKMGYDRIHKPKGYWIDKTIISELKSVIDELGHFPTYPELQKIGKSGLRKAISINGGSNYFRDKMGCEILHRSPGYWTEETIISELELVIEELGYFPYQIELAKLCRCDLITAIARYGNLNYFREKIGYNVIKKSPGYWTEDTIISELKIIVEKINHFPSTNELNTMGRKDLLGAIIRHGGFYYFREQIESNPILELKQKSELASYINKRGRKTEEFVKDVITEWAKVHTGQKPQCNVKLSKGNVIEFVCDLDKKIGIDVTNTKASKPATYEQIRRKWRHKDYCLYLDELWIVVFTDILTPGDYEKLNRASPENVKVFSIKEFLTELDYSTGNMEKIDQLNKCTFHNKEEIINPNRTVDVELVTT